MALQHPVDIRANTSHKAWRTYMYSHEDLAGLDVCYEWLTSAYHSKHYTNRFQ